MQHKFMPFLEFLTMPPEKRKQMIMDAKHDA
jgi:hypothetical protein